MIIYVKNKFIPKLKIDTQSWTMEEKKVVSDIGFSVFNVSNIDDLTKLISKLQGIPERAVYFSREMEILEKTELLAENKTYNLLYKQITCEKH